jgi:hypothetical protein
VHLFAHSRALLSTCTLLHSLSNSIISSCTYSFTHTDSRTHTPYFPLVSLTNSLTRSRLHSGGDSYTDEQTGDVIRRRDAIPVQPGGSLAAIRAKCTNGKTVLGDVNGDCKFTVKDALLTAQYR